MFDRCRCKRLRQVLALSDQSMPLHDTGEQAGSGLGLSLVSTKIRYHGRRREAHLVRRRNENAGKSVSRKVCPLCLQTYLLSLSRLRSNASDRWRRRGILCAIRKTRNDEKYLLRFTRFVFVRSSRDQFVFFFRKVYETRSRKESNVTLISLNATVIHFQSTNRSSSIEPNKWFKYFSRPDWKIWSLSPEGNIHNFQRSKTFLPYYKKHVLYISQTSIRNIIYRANVKNRNNFARSIFIFV